MVRAVNSKPKQVRSLAKGQQAILLPGPLEAEPWEVWVFGSKGAEPDIVQACQTPLDNRLRKSTTLALPVSLVYCLPLWLNETDPRQLAGMIPLQLELRGLQPRNEQVIFDWSVVAKEETRTLVLVGVLPASLPAELHAEAYSSFDLSARCYTFEPNAVTLWREQDHLVFAITRGPNLVYFQALTELEINPRIIQDLSCARITLDMQDILAPLQKVVLWSETKPAERTALQAALNLPVVHEDAPAPEPPASSWKLTPASVGEARRARESQRWIKRLAVLLLVLYLAAVGWFVAQYVLVSLKVAELKKWQAEHATALDLVEGGRASWKELAPVVDTKHYPLELLHQAQRAIPADQLHLTLFESNSDGHLLIKGEAKNVAGAFTFLEKLQADPYFSSYNLTMGNPRPLPNDLASFQIEGSRATTNE
jgi:hypothetical protein